jgi:O-antigen/teichoic acid export membrane protein
VGIVLTFILNAGLNLVIGLAVAGVLGPAEYGRFALAAMLAIVLGTALFEWLRLSTTRFIADGGEALRASLEAGYLVLGLALLALAGLAPLAGLDPGVTGAPLAVVALAAVATARFEFRAAEARALFQDGAYLRLVGLKNGFSLALMLGAAALMASATWVLAMLALSAALACLLVRAAPGRPILAVTAARRADLALFARYGLPIVGANLVYQVIVLVNRGVGAGELGLAEAGRLSLATDLTIRLLLSVGAALDAYLFQRAVRRREEAGEAAGHRQVADNMIVVAAVLAFLGVAYAAAMPALEALFVPASFRGSFGALALILLPGVLAFCFVQFGLNPVLQLAGRTTALLWAALAALAAHLALVALLVGPYGLTGLALAHAGALVAGALAALVPAIRAARCWPSARDAIAVLVAAGLAGAAMWPFRDLASPWLALVGAGAAGVLAFAAVLVAFDVLGLRGAVRARLAGARPQAEGGAP